MTDSVKVIFLETRVVDDERKGTKFEERYEAGESYDLPPSSAERWVKRGVAEFANDEDVQKGRVRIPEAPPKPKPQDGAGGTSTDGAGQNGGEGAGKPAIPADWRDLHHVKMIPLAKQFDENVSTKAQAIEVLERAEKAAAETQQA